MKKWQLVFVPFSPAITHIVSTIEFAKLLINHDDHLSITVLIIKALFDANADAYSHSLASSLSSSKRLQFILLPDHQPDSTSSQSLHPSSFLDTLVKNQKPHVRKDVSNLISAPDSPQLAGFVVDVFCTTMIDVANEFGVPAMVFYASGAAVLGFILHLHTLRERDNVDTTAFNFKESGTEVAIPSFVNPVPTSVFPILVLDKEWETLFYNLGRGLRKAKGIIVNTFEELEPHAIHSFSNRDIAIYPVGPILGNPAQHGSDVMMWLDDQPPSSVIFMCFGSRGCFEEDQVREIAWALERSGVRFLWSLQKPPPKGSTAPPNDYSNLAEVLPEGFLERTTGIGKVVGWAPQAHILAHQAVGGFVSHCGWNSILESIHFGVPIATWPLDAEQQLNAFELVCELKMAVEICLDYRIKFEKGGKLAFLLSSERIEKGIRHVMEEENEIRKKVKEMSEKSKKALREDGSSYSYLGRLIHDIYNELGV